MFLPKMNSNYWKQRATPWVTYSVLLGGLFSAILLVMIYRMENDKDIVLYSAYHSAGFIH